MVPNITMNFLADGKKIASGRTEPGCTKWVQYPGGKGIYVDVDAGAARFTGTPVYTASIGGNSSHWSTTGATSIYLASATGFRVYVRWVDYSPLTPAQANRLQWHINWIGMEVD